MISSEQIQQAVERLVAAANPSKMILFGSYARGDATEDSDLDFMVIEPQLQDKFGEMVRLRQVLRPLRIPVDVLVYSQSYVDEWGTCRGQHCTGRCMKGRCCMKSALDPASRYLELVTLQHHSTSAVDVVEQ